MDKQFNDEAVFEDSDMEVPEKCDSEIGNMVKRGHPMHENKYILHKAAIAKRVAKSRKANKLASKQRKLNRR